ncbi:glycine-rich domain-containing protein [Flavobacterium sp.]|uniref:glycine-rich domain-containing protein n=1 Tax=Flavobacterium sp. TaxID=239 RepID=UPI0037512A50
MTKNEKQLWDKISQFNFNDEGNDFKFSDRLARENNWSLNYAKKVIEEYKKFLFLCCVTTTGIIPSDQVDQAWHLHLTYTKSYWIDLCKNTLEKEIHHNPTKGGISEAIKFDFFYSKTNEDYKIIFNAEPPVTIWPNNENRFSDIHFKRINTSQNWIIKKPTGKQKSVFYTVIVSLTSSFFIQATSQNTNSIPTIILIIAVALILYLARNGKNNKNGGSGCSSGCSTDSGQSGCSGHSGCSGDGGCSSGCGGCGGGD